VAIQNHDGAWVFHGPEDSTTPRSTAAESGLHDRKCPAESLTLARSTANGLIQTGMKPEGEF
jgi:hypothetical protein